MKCLNLASLPSVSSPSRDHARESEIPLFLCTTTIHWSRTFDGLPEVDDDSIGTGQKCNEFRMAQIRAPGATPDSLETLARVWCACQYTSQWASMIGDHSLAFRG
jgi:hypothetical protein